jgi:hypothetical protein
MDHGELPRLGRPAGVIPMTGGRLAHQRIVFSLCLSLMG